jgi:hypothetical protein
MHFRLEFMLHNRNENCSEMDLRMLMVVIMVICVANYTEMGWCCFFLENNVGYIMLH